MPASPGARIARALLPFLVPALTMGASSLAAQAPQPLSRADAVARALGASPRGVVLAADTLVAAGRLAAARAYPNPIAAATYSRSAPQRHVVLDIPMDLPYVRGPRVRAAQAAATGARFTFLAARAALELDADTLYTRAQGAALLARLSATGAAEALRLLRVTQARRTAGDASDLEVNLAEVGWEQAANVAATDSLNALTTLLDLQSVLALRSDSVAVILTDSLGPPSAPAMSALGALTPGATSTGTLPASVLTSMLTVQAATASLTAAQQSLALQRYGIFTAPALQVGVEGYDPTGVERGLLPTFGIALPLPLFNWNRGAIAAARADVLRARAQLDITRRDAAAAVARAWRTRSATVARLARDSSTVQSATRNSALTERAYTEGEMTISDVLVARRAQRDAETQYVTDLVAARASDALIRVLTSPASIR